MADTKMMQNDQESAKNWSMFNRKNTVSRSDIMPWLWTFLRRRRQIPDFQNVSRPSCQYGEANAVKAKTEGSFFLTSHPFHPVYLGLGIFVFIGFHMRRSHGLTWHFTPFMALSRDFTGALPQFAVPVGRQCLQTQR